MCVFCLSHAAYAATSYLEPTWHGHVAPDGHQSLAMFAPTLHFASTYIRYTTYMYTTCSKIPGCSRDGMIVGSLQRILQVLQVCNICVGPFQLWPLAPRFLGRLCVMTGLTAKDSFHGAASAAAFDFRIDPDQDFQVGFLRSTISIQCPRCNFGLPYGVHVHVHVHVQ